MPIERELSGDVLRFRLDDEQSRVADPEVLQQQGRSARTLLKDGPLRVTLIALAAGGHVAEHSADGPITVQPLTGSIRFSAGGRDYELRPGELLSVRAGLRHSVSSDQGGSFLLTISLAP